MSSKKQTLTVSECFYSIQGEGQTMGIPAVFLRLAKCNLLCKSNFWVCDSIEVWQQGVKTEFSKVLSKEYVNRLREGAHLIITGGEPMLHQRSIVRFLEWFHNVFKFWPITEIETNATLMPDDSMLKYVDYWNCSPKLENSGEPFERRVKPLVIKTIDSQENAIFKFVISTPTDVIDLMQDYGDHLTMKNVVLMPAGETQEKLNETRKTVIDQCLLLGLRYSERLHIVIWNQKTGV